MLALLIACVCWGALFTWAKQIMEEVNDRAGLSKTALLGVLLLQSWRFALAGILWVIAFPAARVGWSWSSFGRAVLLSVPFTAAMIVQQVGLTRTSPAVNAFLTGLNVLFVPLILALVTGRLPRPTLWIGIALALLGTWLLAGGGPGGIGVGELLGVGCSILFSIHILLINLLLKDDSPARMIGGQFILTSILCIAITLCVAPSRSPHLLLLPVSAGLRLNLLLLIIFSTIVAFGLMLFFQPQVDPTCAAFVYLTEPIFAAGFAWVIAGQKFIRAWVSRGRR